MNHGDIVRHTRSGKYAIVISQIGQGKLLRVCQVHIKVDGSVVRQNMTTWRADAVESPTFSFLQVEHGKVRAEAFAIATGIVESERVRNYWRRDAKG